MAQQQSVYDYSIPAAGNGMMNASSSQNNYIMSAQQKRQMNVGAIDEISPHSSKHDLIQMGGGNASSAPQNQYG